MRNDPHIIQSYVIPEFITHVFIKGKGYKIGFNILYSNKIHWSVRNEIMHALKLYICGFLKPISIPFPYPITIAVDYYMPYNYGEVKLNKIGKIELRKDFSPESCTWDIDNFSVFWRKAIADSLVDRKIISADTAIRVNRYEEEFYPVLEFNSRKIVVTLKHN